MAQMARADNNRDVSLVRYVRVFSGTLDLELYVTCSLKLQTTRLHSLNKVLQTTFTQYMKLLSSASLSMSLAWEMDRWLLARCPSCMDETSSTVCRTSSSSRSLGLRHFHPTSVREPGRIAANLLMVSLQPHTWSFGSSPVSAGPHS